MRYRTNVKSKTILNNMNFKANNMQYEKINLDRLGKFALYLRTGTLKTQKLSESFSNGRELLTTGNTFGPLLYFPIMELPIIFQKE